MADKNSIGQIEDVAAMTRAVENLFRKLVRFLVGKISLVKLQEMIRYIFIEEIEDKLRRENPTKNVPLSQIALLSGLDTRTLNKVRNSRRYRKPLHQETSFLKEFVPGASILHVWSSTPPYMDQTTREPINLEISGDDPSFESLFVDSIKIRGVTYKSLLERLKESGSVSIDEQTGKVVLVSKSYLPSASNDQLGAIEIGFAALSNLADTVTKNIKAIETGGDRLFQRGTWTHRLQWQYQDDLRSELNKFLEKTDLGARKIIKKFEDKSLGPEQLTAGVGFFYFEEETNP